MNVSSKRMGLLPIVATETVRYWLRRHLVAFVFIAAASIISTIFALAGRLETAPRLWAALAVYAPFLLGVLCMSGIVADERASGLIVMWFQKPGSLFRAYLVRYLLNQLMLLAGTTVLAAIVVLTAVLAGGFETTSPLRLVLGMLLLAMLPAAIVFAFSAWGVRRDSTVAVVVVFLSLMLSAALTRSDQPAAALVRTVAFPFDPIIALVFGGLAYPPGILRPIAIIMTHVIGWSALGLLGLRVTERTLHHHS